jgi:hypothetical protein
MWYHYLLILAGLYLVGSAIFSIISNRSMTNLIMSGVQGVIGAAIAYYGYSSAMAPPPGMFQSVAPTMNAMMGGMRKMMGGRR